MLQKEEPYKKMLTLSKDIDFTTYCIVDTCLFRWLFSLWLLITLKVAYHLKLVI